MNPDEPAKGTFACPICGIETPHAHPKEELADWVTAQLSRFGLEGQHIEITSVQERRERLATAWDRGYGDGTDDTCHQYRHPSSDRRSPNPYRR